MSQKAEIAIIGAAESDIGKTRIEGISSGEELATQAALRAMDDAGVTKDEIDGLFHTAPTGVISTPQLGEYMGLYNLKYFDSTWVGGASWVLYLEHAAAAIAAGLCSVALIAYGETAATNRKRGIAPIAPLHRTSYPSQFEAPYGNYQVSNYALIARRHMYEYGTKPEQLAEIAVATRKWAALNPKARFRDPITIDDVLSSRMIADPLHLLDCCLVSDGGGAVIVTSAERAQNYRKKPVYVLGTGENQQHVSMSQMPDFTSMSAKYSGQRAFERAGVSHEDIDLAMIYDSFTITALVTLEDLGFCKKGEGGDFVSGQRTAPGGDFPMNTNGGGLSYCHPGMYGIFTLIESVVQLRGEAGERQVPDCRIALANGTGGDMSASGTAILSTELSS